MTKNFIKLQIDGFAEHEIEAFKSKIPQTKSAGNGNDLKPTVYGDIPPEIIEVGYWIFGSRIVLGQIHLAAKEIRGLYEFVVGTKTPVKIDAKISKDEDSEPDKRKSFQYNPEEDESDENLERFLIDMHNSALDDDEIDPDHPQ